MSLELVMQIKEHLHANLVILGNTQINPNKQVAQVVHREVIKMSKAKQVVSLVPMELFSPHQAKKVV